MYEDNEVHLERKSPFMQLWIQVKRSIMPDRNLKSHKLEKYRKKPENKYQRKPFCNILFNTNNVNYDVIVSGAVEEGKPKTEPVPPKDLGNFFLKTQAYMTMKSKADEIYETFLNVEAVGGAKVSYPTSFLRQVN